MSFFSQGTYVGEAYEISVKVERDDGEPFKLIVTDMEDIVVAELDAAQINGLAKLFANVKKVAEEGQS